MRTPGEVRGTIEFCRRTDNLYARYGAFLSEYADLLEAKPKWRKVAEEKPPRHKTFWLRATAVPPFLAEIWKLDTKEPPVNFCQVSDSDDVFSFDGVDYEWTLAIPPE